MIFRSFWCIGRMWSGCWSYVSSWGLRRIFAARLGVLAGGYGFLVRAGVLNPEPGRTSVSRPALSGPFGASRRFARFGAVAELARRSSAPKTSGSNSRNLLSPNRAIRRRNAKGPETEAPPGPWMLGYSAAAERIGHCEALQSFIEDKRGR